MRIIELCAYILIIIAALIWMFMGGKIYDPPEYEPPAITQPADTSERPPPVVLPKGEVFPEQ